MGILCRTWVMFIAILVGAAMVQKHHYLLVEVPNITTNGESTKLLCSAVRSYTTQGSNIMTILSAMKLDDDKSGTPISCKELYKILQDTVLAMKVWTRCGVQSGQIDWFILVDVSRPIHNKLDNTITFQYGSEVHDMNATAAYKKHNVEEIFPVEAFTEKRMATISISSYTSEPLEVSLQRYTKQADLHSMVKLNIKNDKILQELAKSELTTALLFVSMAYEEYPKVVIEDDWRRANIYDSYLNGVEWLTLEVDLRPAEVKFRIDNNTALRDDLRNSKLTTIGFAQLNEKSNTITISKPPQQAFLMKKEVDGTSNASEGWKICVGSSFVWWKEFVVKHKIWGSPKMFVQYLDWSKETKWIALNTNVLSSESNTLLLSYKSLDENGKETEFIP